MVFGNLALFELHLDDASFTTGSSDTRDADEPEQSMIEESATERDDTGGRGLPMKLAVVGIALATTAFTVRRRRRDRRTAVDDYAEDEGGLADPETAELDDVDA
jgi:hypothetical protein